MSRFKLEKTWTIIVQSGNALRAENVLGRLDYGETWQLIDNGLPKESSLMGLLPGAHASNILLRTEKNRSLSETQRVDPWAREGLPEGDI